ncbi:MAG: DUF2304 domain-containing protein [Lachnospiraceae bacterium]|nr:DUF2304 domain-containing protein [Lachnospiraceae bacterium]
MDIRIQITVGVTIVVALVIIVNMIRNKKLELRYALAWLLVGVGILIFDCFPQILKALASVLGVWRPINMLFFLGFCFSLGIIFTLTVAVSRMSVRIKKLAQQVALLEESTEE